MRAKLHIAIALSCAVWSVLLPAVTKAELQITAIQSQGILTWSNYLPNATYRVEWATSAGGPWNTNLPEWNISATSNITTAEVPMFYRVAWIDPPDIRYGPVHESINGLGTSTIDLTDDSETDFIIQRTWMTSGWTSSEISGIRAYQTLDTPFSYGDLIGPATAWCPTNTYYSIGTRSNFGPYTSGPWAGVTNAYFPVGFLMGTNVHYGWIHVELTLQHVINFDTGEPTDITYESLALTDSAWHTIPNTPLSAGQLE